MKSCAKVLSVAALSMSFLSLPLMADEKSADQKSNSAVTDQDAAAPVPTRANENDPDSQIYRASDIMGLPVKNDQKQEIGKIKDLVINGSTREVLYAVVGMTEGKEKDAVYVMPWTEFQPSFGQGNAIQYTVLMIPQTVWMQAPYWTNSQWRQTPYSQWSPRVNEYYEAHVHTNTANNSKSSSVTTSKPVLNPDEEKNKTPSSSDKDKSATPSTKDAKPQPKKEANQTTYEPKPKLDTKPAPKAETKTAPKPEPAGPKATAPSANRDPKAPAPAPK